MDPVIFLALFKQCYDSSYAYLFDSILSKYTITTNNSSLCQLFTLLLCPNLYQTSLFIPFHKVLIYLYLCLWSFLILFGRICLLFGPRWQTKMHNVWNQNPKLQIIYNFLGKKRGNKHLIIQISFIGK